MGRSGPGAAGLGAARGGGTHGWRDEGEEDLHRQLEELRRQRREAEVEHAQQARRGDAGPARKRLQERMDRGETTWRDVLSGRDDHWSAQDVRDEVAREARQEIDRLELEDEEFRRTYRQDAVLRRGQQTGDWGA